MPHHAELDRRFRPARRADLVRGLDLAMVTADAGTMNDRLVLLRAGCSTDHMPFVSNEEFDALLTTNGVRRAFQVAGGAHAWRVRRRSLTAVAPPLSP